MGAHSKGDLYQQTEKKRNSSERNLRLCSHAKHSNSKILTSPKPRLKQKSASKNLEMKRIQLSLFQNLLQVKEMIPLNLEGLKLRKIKLTSMKSSNF